MLTQDFTISSESLVISAAVLLPLLAVVAGCAICHRLCRTKDEEADEDEESRPLLIGSKTEQSTRIETVKAEHFTNSGEQPSTTCTEANLKPDLLKPVDEQVVEEHFEKIHSKYRPQNLETVLEPRLSAEEDIHEKADISNSNENAHNSEDYPRELVAEEKENIAESNSATKTPDDNQNPTQSSCPAIENEEAEQVSSEKETFPDTGKMEATADLASANTGDEKIGTERLVHETLSSVNTEQIEKILDPVDANEDTSEVERRENESLTSDEAKAKDNATALEATSIFDKPGLVQELAVQEISVKDAAVEDLIEENAETDETVLIYERQEAELVVEESSNSKEAELRSKKQEISSNKQEKKFVEIDFDSKPTFVKTIRTKSAKKDGKPIFGLTTLDNELFVVSQRSSNIEVYDSKSLDFKHQFHIENLLDPVDIASCSASKSLYLFDWKGDTNEIFKLDSGGRLLLKWSTGQNGGFLSITPEGEVMLSVWDRSVILQYSSEGEEIREIQLPSTIVKLRFGIKLTNGNIIVSHGDGEETEHRVCLLDENGSEIRSYGGVKGFSRGQFDSPNYMSVERRSGFVLVADQNNKQVVLLDSELEFKRRIVKESDGLRYPVRLELDDVNGRLFVVDNDYSLNDEVWRDGKIMIFDFRIRQPSAEP